MRGFERVAWSKIVDYDRGYMPIQAALRAIAASRSIPPIALDLAWWQAGA